MLDHHKEFARWSHCNLWFRKNLIPLTGDRFLRDTRKLSSLLRLTLGIALYGLGAGSGIRTRNGFDDHTRFRGGLTTGYHTPAYWRQGQDSNLQRLYGPHPLSKRDDYHYHTLTQESNCLYVLLRQMILVI